MARYFAELNGSTVERVIVAPDLNWCTDNLGGTWVETAAPSNDPDGDTGPPGAYPGRGWGVDETAPERFASQYVALTPEQLLELDPQDRADRLTMRVFHEGRIVPISAIERP